MRILKYPGSKWRIADEIIGLIPEHHSYLEPFFGSGAIFFRKRPSDIETINNLDDNIPNLFRCIKEDSEKLARIVALTPYSRYEYERAFGKSEEDEYQRAVDFLITCWQGHGFRTNKYRVGWKNDVHGRERMYSVREWCKLPENILAMADRLKQVQIDNRPAVEIIKRFDFDDVFMYIDPPYVLSTRSGKQYKHEMTDDEHVELLNILKGTKAKVMISGYESALYDAILKGWNKQRFRSNAEHGAQCIETVWMNYELNHQINFFDLEKSWNRSVADEL